ncbi:hypothetical protein GCM10007424_14320 [Flavobacterium suaedae]|uniref:Putative auto-transporter adhesin head GIN domain-containing protein n=1 Tax=Flavobacterium suaedae TaxID=1767027 RepID=A0ABQ1JS89_9FLAO|nr:DUF2807 domain-containing protein [Flavobacterium suaedae]GGB75523.1 hypothetical protein GCM10007424_14320 [Flavobacterium suaedae]
MKTMLFLVATALSSIVAVAQNSENRNIKGFNELKVQQGIEVIYTYGEKESVKVEANNTEILKNVVTENRKGKLNIYLKTDEEKLFAGKNKVTVYITDNDTRSIEAITGATIKISNQITVPQLSVILKTGAIFKGKINATEKLTLKINSGAGFQGGIITDKLITDVTGGGFVELTGHAENSIVFCSGGTLNAEKFTTEKADIRAKHLSSVGIGVKQSLSGETDQSSAIVYYGKPIKVETSDNVSMIKRD